MFVPYRESKILKQLGFDEPCFRAYDNAECLYFSTNSENGYIYNHNLSTAIVAPTFEEAFDYIRNKFGLHINPNPCGFEILDYNNEHISWGCIVDELNDHDTNTNKLWQLFAGE